MKRSLGRIVGDAVLSYGGLQTVMFDIASLLNDRSIGYKSGYDPDEDSVLRPNDLLGHSMVTVPSALWERNSNFSKGMHSKIRLLMHFGGNGSGTTSPVS